jgi:hypothetical protein
MQFAPIMRDQLAGSGIPPSTYVDSGGLNPRADIAGLHQVPSVPGARQHEEPVRLGADEDAGGSLEPHGLVVRNCGQHGLWLGVNQDGAGRADLSHRGRLLLAVEVSV